jgi:hypothetical protein
LLDVVRHGRAPPGRPLRPAARRRGRHQRRRRRAVPRAPYSARRPAARRPCHAAPCRTALHSPRPRCARRPAPRQRAVPSALRAACWAHRPASPPWRWFCALLYASRVLLPILHSRAGVGRRKRTAGEEALARSEPLAAPQCARATQSLVTNSQRERAYP